MLRRLVLVGFLILVKRGSIVQLAFGMLFALLYLAIQSRATPFRKAADDFFATACSVALAALFLLALLFKNAELTASSRVRDVLAPAQRSNFAVSYALFSGLATAAVVAALVLLAGVICALFTKPPDPRRRPRSKKGGPCASLLGNPENEHIL